MVDAITTALSHDQVGIDTDHFPEFKSTIDFNKQLVIEQSVFCLPGEVSDCLKQKLTIKPFMHSFIALFQAFFYPGYFRVVLVMPCEKVAEACRRIAKFCSEHYQ